MTSTTPPTQTPTDDALLTVDDLAVAFPAGRGRGELVQVVDGGSFPLDRGETLAVVASRDRANR